MLAGAEDLEQWLQDAIRQGLAALDHQQDEWNNITSRMVDAKLGGLAQRIKAIASYREEGWPERITAVFGQLYLATRGLEHYNVLPEQLKQQLLQELGVRIKKKDLLTREGISDDWLVLSRWQGLNLDEAAIQKTWLWALEKKKIALLIEYDYTGAGFETDFSIGQIMAGEMVYYPESYPVRAILKMGSPSRKSSIAISGHADIEQLLEAYAKALSINPWLLFFPCMLDNVIPEYHQDEFVLIDQSKKYVPVKAPALSGWTLISMSSGQPITVFGEWSGKHFHPLSAFSEGRFIDLGNLNSDTSGAKRFRNFS